MLVYENLVYDRIMLADECMAMRHRNEQSIVVENVTFNRKVEHNFIASQYSVHTGRDGNFTSAILTAKNCYP